MTDTHAVSHSLFSLCSLHFFYFRAFSDYNMDQFTPVKVDKEQVSWKTSNVAPLLYKDCDLYEYTSSKSR